MVLGVDHGLLAWLLEGEASFSGPAFGLVEFAGGDAGESTWRGEYGSPSRRRGWVKRRRPWFLILRKP